MTSNALLVRKLVGENVNSVNFRRFGKEVAHLGFLHQSRRHSCSNDGKALFGGAPQRAGFGAAVVETQGHAIGAAAGHDERQEINLAHPVAALCQSRH